MSIDNMPKCNPTDGVAIASVVVKGTTEGKWNGTGGGVGYGTGGLGLFVGGMSGSKTEQTLLAKELEMPDGMRAKAFSTEWLFPVFGLVMGMFAFVGADIVLPDLLKLAPGTGGNNIETPFTSIVNEFFDGNESNLFAWGLKGMAVLVFLMAAFQFMKPPSKREKEDYERREKTKAELRKIYHRLRYVEKDHIVFDPESGMELPATEENIRILLQEIFGSAIQMND